MHIKIIRKIKAMIFRLTSCVYLFKYRKDLNYYRYEKLKHQPIFIIGAPRTGSTILYQALTNYYDVSYIDNCVDKWHRNLFYGFKESYKKFSNNPHNTFKAEFGSTSNFSEHAPSECGSFWYRWLPKDRHFVDANEICKKSKEQLYTEVCAVTNYFDKPLMFKNLNAGQRLRFIKEVFPDARFIYIKRDHEKVKNSILKAREKNNIEKGTIWSVKPKKYDDLLILSNSDMVSQQILRIENQIEQDSNLFDEFYTVKFNDFSKVFIRELGNKLKITERDGSSLPIFKKDY